VAVTLGLIFFLASISLPLPAASAVTYLANLTAPLSLLLIGVLLSQANWKEFLGKKRLYFTCVLKLLLVPIITYVLLYVLGAPLLIRQVFVLIQALPTATALVLFAEKYNNDSIEGSELVFMSTVLSVVTIPIMMYFLV